MASTTYVARRPGPFAALIQVSQLGGFRLEPMAPLRTTDQYWDTEDGELLRSGLALRVREQGGRRTASVRAIRQTDSGPEADASATDLPPDGGSGALALPAGLLADTIEALTGADPLHLLLTLRQYRTPRIVFDGDRAVALASFDVVAYDAQGRQIVSNEVEIDLAERGTAQDLANLDTLLRLHDLEPEPLSKLERGVVRLPRTSSQPLLLLPSERDHLEAVAAGDDALRSRRARVILLDARGFRADTVAAQTGLSTGRVRHWKQRFLDERMSLFAADGAFAVDETPRPHLDEPAMAHAPTPREAQGVAVPAAPPFSGSGDGTDHPEPADALDDPRDAEDLDSLLAFFQPGTTDTPLIPLTGQEADADDALDTHEEEFQGTQAKETQPSETAALHDPSQDAPAEPAHVAEPSATTDEPASGLSVMSLADLMPAATGASAQDDAPTHEAIEDAPDRPRRAYANPRLLPLLPATDAPDAAPQAEGPRVWTPPTLVALTPEPPSEAPADGEATPPIATPADAPPRRPRLHGDTPLLDAAQVSLAYAVASFEHAVDAFLRRPGAHDARRVLLAAHRTRLAAESFAPFLPREAADRVVRALRVVADAAEQVLEAARRDPTHASSEFELSVASLRGILDSGRQRAWGARARRLLDRLGAQQADGLLLGDDFPAPPDDFAGRAGDLPVPTRLRHVLASLLWTRYEAIRSFEDEMRPGMDPELAYHLAIAVSGLHYVLGIAEQSAHAPVADMARTLDEAERVAASFRHAHADAQPTEGDDAQVLATWEALMSDAFRSDLAAIAASI